jgi:hypothetical protein
LDIVDRTGDDCPAQLDAQVAEILKRLTRSLEDLGDGSPYDSTSAFTPQGNRHTAYANGFRKDEGSEAVTAKSGLSVAAQLDVFEQISRLTLEAIAKEKPEDRNRLIWRVKPRAERELRESGLHLKIYTRLGWDNSEGKE